MLRHDDLDSRETTPIPMTYPEWLAWASESRQSEWEDSRAIPFPPPAICDAQARLAVATVLGGFVAERGLGVLLIAPFEMRLTRAVREPAFLFVTTANRAWLTEERLVGPADLIVEVVSDDSEHRDLVTKFAEYADAGISEYWIGGPRRERGTLERFARSGRVPADTGRSGWLDSVAGRDGIWVRSSLVRR